MPNSPEIIASACGAGLWPPNTLAAARHCLDVAVDGIEIDVQLTRDGVPVLLHDFRFAADATRLDGTWLAEASPPIHDLDFATARRFDVGSRRPESELRAAYPQRVQWDGTPVPTLAEIWEEMAARTDRPRTLIIEIKTSPQEPDECAEIGAITRAVVDYVRTHATPAIRPRIIAFDWAVLRLCQTLAPDIPAGHLVIPKALEGDVQRDAAGHSPWTDGHDPARFDGSVARAVAAHGGTQLSMYHPDITIDSIAEATALGLSVAAWGYARTEEYDALRGSRLDSVTVSGPDWRYRDGNG